jgi:hypothetical protein
MIVDPEVLETKISNWLKKNSVRVSKQEYITVDEILWYVFRITKLKSTQGEKIRISKVLTGRLYWRKGLSIFRNGTTFTPYYPPVGWE